ncbi:MAG: CpaD family pilus assembly lipoprotein [Rhizobiaceae bacterium]|nr:CpaD family pilus assembly lipoprotein [Rhizobiaceae bacterium]
MLRVSMRIVTVAAPLAMIALAGCADRMKTATIPDDYRTNHPISISEQETSIDLPVGSTERGATRAQVQTLEGFLANYDKHAAPVLMIMRPNGALNDAAAARAAKDFARVAKANGVPAGRISIVTYEAGAPDVSAPVRVAYNAIRATTNECGLWPEDLTRTRDNTHYANFGCAYQNNVAAQLSNPNDLLGPRKQTTIDAENRSVVIDDYRVNSRPFVPTINY